MSAPVSVVIAHAHAPTRAGMTAALEGHGFEVASQVSTAALAVEHALGERPDICLLDIEIPGDGIWAVTQIAKSAPDTAVVILSPQEDADALLDALRAGAVGYLVAGAEGGRLPQALRGVLAGEAVVPRRLVSRLIDELRHQGRRRRLRDREGRGVELTGREWEVFELIRDGLTTADTAQRLFVSPVTVRRHVSTVVKKLGVKSREAALELLDQAV
jgi:DNA-binding NarL/FixJ family response regulator